MRNQESIRTIEEISQEIDFLKGKKLSYERLVGGLTNYSYKVMVDDQPYFLRINSNKKSFLALDRDEEVKAIKKASVLGLAAKVLFGNDEYIVTEFLEGRNPTYNELREPENIQKVVDILKKVHTIEDVYRNCSPFDLVSGFLDEARKTEKEWPEGLDEAIETMDIIQENNEKYAPYLGKYCHNDAHERNMLVSSYGEYKLIDWEHSGYGNIMFELATLSSIYDYTEVEDKLLLRSYFGYYEDEFKQLLKDMRFMHTMLTVAWSLANKSLDPKNYTDYINSSIQKIKRMINN